MQITVERLRPSGMLLLTTIYKGEYYSHRYMDYTEKQAKRAFREHIHEQDAKIIREAIFG